MRRGLLIGPGVEGRSGFRGLDQQLGNGRLRRHTAFKDLRLAVLTGGDEELGPAGDTAVLHADVFLPGHDQGGADWTGDSHVVSGHD